MRRGILLVLVAVFLVTPILTSAQSLKLVNADGQLQSEIQGIKSGGTVLANLVDFFRTLDFSINWDDSLENLAVNKDNKEYRFRPDSKFVKTPGDKITLASAPKFQDGSLYLEVQSLVNIFGENSSRSLIWNEARNHLQLRSQSQWGSEGTQNDPIGEFIEGTGGDEDDGMLVVVDPGHGGRDPGAIGYSGLQEKLVVLRMSEKIKRELENSYDDISVRLTRSSDNFLPLQKRTQIANELNADLFISVHANSGRSSVAKGFEVFTLSGEASDPSAKELAEIENSALRYEGYSKNELDDVSWILWQLRSTIHTRESRRVAELMASEMEQSLPVKNRGLNQAPFWVLKDARMPAILLESGFLSNPEGEQRLRTKSYQRKVARSVAEAIDRYQSKRSE